MNNLDKQYQDLLRDILENGVKKGDRTGTGTISVFGRQIRHKMSEGFPIITTKKMAWKSIVTELLWFLKGGTNIKYLLENGCHIWDGDAWKNYKNKAFLDGSIPATKEEFIERIKTDDEFAKKWGELGPIYGAQWRSWRTGKTVVIEHTGTHNIFGEKVIDQISNLINDLKTNPDSRRLMVSAWNPSELENMILPPCHYAFQCYTHKLSTSERIHWLEKNKPNLNVFNELKINDKEDKKSEEIRIQNILTSKCNVPILGLSLMFQMRSQDTFLGMPFNLSSYGLLLCMIANKVNMIPYELIQNGGDVHLYENHIEQAREQLTRESYPLPIINISDRDVVDISEYTFEDIQLVGYKSHTSIKAPLSN